MVLQVRICDQWGNAINANVGFMETRLEGSRSGKTLSLQDLVVDRLSSGVFLFYLVTAVADDYAINVVIDSEAVPRFPTLTIEPTTASPTTSIVDISGMMSATAGEVFSVGVTPRDKYGCVPHKRMTPGSRMMESKMILFITSVFDSFFSHACNELRFNFCTCTRTRLQCS